MMLGGVIFSITRPSVRIWPPPKQGSWQHYLAWFLFSTAVTLTVVLALLTLDSWVISPEIRCFIGIPISLIGGLLLSWGIVTLGIENTSGAAGGFIGKGPYRFTRNPQYLGDMALFLGLALLINSLYVAVPLILQSIVFAITPLSEEPWLEEQYDNE